MAHITLTTGPRAGDRIEIVGELTVGRETADIVVADDEMSRRHAVLRVSDGALSVEDLGSLNGTWVEGRRIDRPTELADGAEVKLGGTVARVELRDPHATRLSITPPEPAGDRSDLTVVGHVAGAAATVTGRAIAEEPPARTVPAPAAPPPAAVVTPQAPRPAQAPFGTVLRQGRRRRRVATRSIPAAAFVSAVVVADAAALVVYFSGR
jgi:hypothetical protein